MIRTTFSKNGGRFKSCALYGTSYIIFEFEYEIILWMNWSVVNIYEFFVIYDF